MVKLFVIPKNSRAFSDAWLQDWLLRLGQLPWRFSDVFGIPRGEGTLWLGSEAPDVHNKPGAHNCPIVVKICWCSGDTQGRVNFGFREKMELEKASLLGSTSLSSIKKNFH